MGSFLWLNFILVLIVPLSDSLKCYTCLGRDYENCKRGVVTCEGSCFKLVDETHLLFAKGCDPNEERGKNGTTTTKEQVKLEEVKLPWDEKNPIIIGAAHYCTTEDFCNGSGFGRSVQAVSGTATAILCLFIAKLLL